jgi:DNA modification methylase
MRKRLAEPDLHADHLTNRLFHGDAAEVAARFPAGSIDLIVTSPPYWTAVEYEGDTNRWPSYESYLADMQRVWNECARVLRPNAKLCVNAPILPIPKKIIEQHTRHLKNIAADMEQKILRETDLVRYGLFVWQKQTSKMMFGSYPHPGNILENNTVEFIHVYVKPGAPPKFPRDVKAANRLSRTEWLDLTQQVWFMYPQDVKRGGEHPAPFPEKLPSRLIRLYSFGACEKFPGEIVLDPFAGTGTTCAAAEAMGRRYVGIDVNARYLQIAAARIRTARARPPMLLVGRPKYPSTDELRALAVREAGTAGAHAARKHKKRTYGRKLGGPIERDPGVARMERGDLPALRPGQGPSCGLPKSLA